MAHSLYFATKLFAGGTKSVFSQALDVDFRDAGGRAIIHEAARFDDVATLEWLQATGADMDLRVNGSGETALIIAARHGGNKAVRLLLVAEADVTAHEIGRNTPLHNAAAGGHLETCTLLLQAGADYAAENAEGRRPVRLAPDDDFAEDFDSLVDELPAAWTPAVPRERTEKAAKKVNVRRK